MIGQNDPHDVAKSIKGNSISNLKQNTHVLIQLDLQFIRLHFSIFSTFKHFVFGT
jgi:hypothetical protein